MDRFSYNFVDVITKSYRGEYKVLKTSKELESRKAFCSLKNQPQLH